MLAKSGEMMKIGILAIGDEVVSGKTLNSNATFLASTLEANQFEVTRHLAVRDIETEILQALHFLYETANVVITIGGLGPTLDDLTKDVCAKYFDEEMVLYPEVVDKIKTYYQHTHKSMPENNIKQAYFIPGSIIVENKHGTAPGMIYEKAGKVIINLPGPPNELEPMVNEYVLPYLDKLGFHKIYKKQYRLMNIGESDAEMHIKDFYNLFPHIKIASYTGVGFVDYRIITTNPNYKEEFDKCVQAFEERMKENIVGDGSEPLQKTIIDLCREKGLTLAVAESCTGGMITSSIVDISGSSDILIEGVVTYHNDSKMARLGVKEELLEKYGAVSPEVALAMATGVRLTSKADIGISTTGIAGPTGGTKEKPVGLVYSAIDFQGETFVFKNIFRGERNKVRQRATLQILFELYKVITKTF